MTSRLLAPRYRRVTPVPPRPALRLLSDPDSELDVPDRRYRLHGIAANVLREGSARGWLGRNFDPLVAEHLIPFYEAKEACRTPADRERLIDEWPGLFWSDGLYHDPGPARCRIEALLLGGASSSEAAEALHIDPSFAWWYARVFFDVEGRDRAWLADRVMLPALRAGGEYIRENVLWKLVAAVCGWKIFADGNDGVFGGLARNIVAQLDAALGQGVLTDALVSSRTMRISRYNRGELIDQRHRDVDVDLRRLAADAGPGDEHDQLPKLLKMVHAGAGYMSTEHGVERDKVLAGPFAEAVELTNIYSERERLNAERAVDQDAGRVPLSDDT